jgi:cyclohexa-1,5-dienecarbonyl-CoA hydratase
MRDDGVGTITFAHPPLNILTQSLLAEMREALARVSNHRTLRVLILGADGKHFSAGADVGEHLPPRFRSMIPEFLDTIRVIHEFPVPVIAAVRGRCLGGGFELAQAADMVVAGESASFGQPEILLGVFAPAACALLPARCAPGLAAELLFTGDPIDARRRTGRSRRNVVTDDRVDEALGLASRSRGTAPRRCGPKHAFPAPHRTSSARRQRCTDELMQTRTRMRAERGRETAARGRTNERHRDVPR